MPHLFSEIQVVVSREGLASWETRESHRHGSGNVPYQTDGSALHLVRRRTGYDELYAAPVPAGSASLAVNISARVRLRAQGQVEAISGTEKIRQTDGDTTLWAVDSALELDLLAAEPFRGQIAADDAYAEIHRAGRPTASAKSAAQLLDQRIGAMTRTSLLDDLDRFGGAGRMPDHQRWLWQATGLLERDPRIGQDLVARFVAERTSDRARSLMLDLLASVGHPTAQADLLTMLQSEQATTSQRYGVMMQRLGFVERPTPTTVEFLQRQLEGGAPARRPAAYALGAAIAGLERHGEAERAREALSHLVDALDQAQDLDETLALIHGLGNTGSGATAGVLARLAVRKELGIRTAAAQALRRLPDESAVGALGALATDSERSVRRAALSALRGSSHRRGALDEIARALDRGLYQPSEYSVLLDIAADGESDTHGRAIISHIAQDRRTPPNLKRRIPQEESATRASGTGG